MKSINLKYKLILCFLLIGLLPLGIVSFYSYQQSSSSLLTAETNKLTAVNNIKKDSIERYFKTIHSQVTTFANDVMVKDAMSEFTNAFKSFYSENGFTTEQIMTYKNKLNDYYTNEFGKKYNSENNKSIDATKLLDSLSPLELSLQYYYIADNPNPLGSKEGLDFATDISKYSKLHKKYHPSIRQYLQEFGYYDIFLVDINTGHIVYSVFKELDYATSLTTGPYKNTNFATAFLKAKNDLKGIDQSHLEDFKQYTPSYEAPASFISAPIWNDAGEKIGVAIFQMPIDRINNIVSLRSGMGETGESYIFGQDQLLRSDTHNAKDNYNIVNSFRNPAETKLDSEAINTALTGKRGHLITKNYLNQDVLSVFTPVNILGHQWGLVTEMSTEEMFASVSQLKIMMFTAFALSGLVIILFAYFFSSSISSSIKRISNVLFKSAETVSTSSQSLSTNGSELSTVVTNQASALQETVSAVDEINSMVQKNAEAAQKSTEVSANSKNVATSGKNTVEQMIQSIQEISESNQDMTQKIQDRNDELSKIITVISEIGEKTNIINDIVFQTKLLSFNASVEAARAGEQGKGFAVVAEEVGNLATLSGNAALEITEMLQGSIQMVTELIESTKKEIEDLIVNGKMKIQAGNQKAQECEQALDEILNYANMVNNMVAEISHASSEQAVGIQQISQSMQELDRTTHQNTFIANKNSKLSEDLNSESNELRSLSSQLNEIVDGLKKQVSSPANVVALNGLDEGQDHDQENAKKVSNA
jgi:methyl-accepting chemotaxis protein